jgi:hypothetical protein
MVLVLEWDSDIGMLVEGTADTSEIYGKAPCNGCGFTSLWRASLYGSLMTWPDPSFFLRDSIYAESCPVDLYCFLGGRPPQGKPQAATVPATGSNTTGELLATGSNTL